MHKSVKSIEAVLLPLFLGAFYALLMWELKLPACLVNTLTGYYCPGCGGTRMMIALFQGNLYQAFRYNPLLFITVPVMSLVFCYKLMMKKENLVWFNRILKGYGMLLIVYGIVRNFIDFLQPVDI